MTSGVDILFATHNGARTLPAMMDALGRLHAPQRSWRIVAVDNASTDDTPAILAEAARTLPMLVLHCPEPGKMPALKLGVGRLSGDLTIFTDDDVLPCVDWLRLYEHAAEQHPDCGLFGGAIEPRKLDEVTGWFEASRRHHAELFARSDHPDGEVDAPAHIFGPNFMVRRRHATVLDQVAASLGPTFASKSAKSFPMGEDTQIMQLLQAQGVRAHYVRAAVVQHLVRRNQTELDFMLQRAERHGRGFAIRSVEQAGFGPARRVRLALKGLRGAMAGQSTGALEHLKPDAETFERLWQARWSVGAWRGALGL